ncbi:ABC-type transport auxiliary lipoprotein family protein [Marichromatium sp. AB31]|uniref:ABC-type transport auxiliary lipoprotein family protein n=1 Tax=Marichromatium sp. AB31 TaxID=2483362 RepID=UPI000F41C8EA|nr:ABC-type transport auxiliary lipoprotein family protein [Marichromatium sp. AB31]RNE88934.1 hypothetical protein EBL84_13645 [Marichromatium sp. AB31]
MVPLTRTLLLLAPLLLGACAGGEPIERDRFYRLAPPPPPSTTTARLDASVQVRDLAARGFLGGRQILYRTRAEPREVGRYDSLLWEEPLPGALADALAEGLRAAGPFARVHAPAERVEADYVLSGELIRFEHLPEAEPPRVAATLGLTLQRARARTPLWRTRLTLDEPLAESTPAAMAAAFERLTAHLVEQAVTALAAHRPGGR